MKKYTHCFFMIGIIAALLTVLSSAAFAEGSVDLMRNGGYRPFLEWRNREAFSLKRKSVIYVYAQEGETIYFGSSVWRAGTNVLNSILSDDTSSVSSNADKYSGATIAITIPMIEGGEPYDPSGTGKGEFEWRSNLTGSVTAGDTRIFLTRPAYENRKHKGCITSLEQEKIGPHIEEIAGTEDGYEPMSFVAPVTGTYAFRFLSSNYGETDPKATDENSGWANTSYPTDSNGGSPSTREANGTVAAWDITVVKDGAKQEGRVWTDMLFLNTGANDVPVNSEIYTLTYDGFQYKVDFNGMKPFGFAMYSNNRGVLFDQNNLAQPDGSRPIGENGNEVAQSLANLRSLTHSFYSFTSTNDVGAAPTRTEMDSNGTPLKDYHGNDIKSTILSNFKPVDPERDSTHKIFFNEPSDEAIEAYTKDGYLITSTDQIEVTNPSSLKYKGEGYAAKEEGDVAYGTIAIGGKFSIDLRDPQELARMSTNTYRIVLDFSKYALNEKNKPIIGDDGNWAKREDMEDNAQKENEKNNIVVLVKVLESEQEEVYWDGQDVYGNNVPVGVYDGIGTSYWEIGAAHFPLIDVEDNPNGIIIERTNVIEDGNDSEEARHTVYYNNETDISENPNLKWYYAGVTNGIYPTIGDGLNKLGGVNSANGAMSYENDQGNYTVLDIWSRYVVEDKSNITIGVSQANRINPATVSFVAEEGTANNGTLKESHISSVDGDFYKATGNKGLEDIYGNTISTGFMTTITTELLEGYNYINWEITIPVTEETYEYTGSSGQTVEATAEPSYIKIPNSPGVNPENEEILVHIASIFGDEALNEDVGLGADEGFEDLGDDPYYAQDEFDSGLTAMSAEDVDGTTVSAGTNNLALSVDSKPVLEDIDPTIVNSGKIYKITGIADNDGTATYTKLKLKLSYQIPKISGGTAVTYGLVIDNLYAPSAVAEASYTKDVASYEALDGTNDIKAGTLDEFKNHNNNEYEKSNQ